MTDLSATLNVLSDMITPAVLIAACGSLTISTSARLGRLMDRTRKLTSQYQDTICKKSCEIFSDEYLVLLYHQLHRATKRTRLLQYSLAGLYLSLSAFLATSVAIGAVSITGIDYVWLPVGFGIFGSVLLFTSSVLLIADSKLALDSVNAEMDYVVQISRRDKWR
ncbi:hypothetical protein CHISP_3020 [Chitinispirillum alkaliphilum]|nr:hypothetical protein CHISP_3020 [Chitinispirillum alkaliphilum]